MLGGSLDSSRSAPSPSDPSESAPPLKVAKKMEPSAVVHTPRACILRVEQELRQLFREPVPRIHVASNEDDILNLSALIIGPEGTPYAGGFFHFKMRILPEYPHKPPVVHLCTTDNGRVRFNPNLYACGKVCLSILGTWSGPAWSSASSLSTILLSIQSLMSPKPYHNEPGFENREDPEAIRNYNEMIEHEVMRAAVCRVLENTTTPSKFNDVIQRHFLMYYHQYKGRATANMAKTGQGFQDPFREGHGRFDYASLLLRLEKARQTILDDIEANYGNQRMTGLTSQKAIDAIAAIQREYSHSCDVAGASASVRQGNPFAWDIAIFGPETSPWEGGIYPAEVHFSVDFPERPPFVRYTCPMFHPNISSDGTPCLETLQVRWNGSCKMKVMLEEMVQLLSHPKAECPLNADATVMFCDDRKKYDREVRRGAQEC